jgi:hypothetical protein
MTPFEIAERFIQLRAHCSPKSMAERMTRISDMIVMPVITFFFIILKKHDIFMIVSAVSKAFSAWREWIEYNNLRLLIQRMYLHTVVVGGPFITTNDPSYMPYVFADAVYRVPSGIGKSLGGTLLG